MDAPDDLAAEPEYDLAVKCVTEPCATRIAARGGAHACTVMKDGTVRCWGANTSGQLGVRGADGQPPPAYAATPRRVSDISDVTDVAATGSGRTGTSCAISSTGEIACFGSNTWGQLGRGEAPDDEPHPGPVVVGGLSAKSVTLTNTFALAIGRDDRLWSWGANDARQLGRTTVGEEAGAPNQAALAESVPYLARASAGTSKTGFALSDGRVLSWGGGTLDELGRATSLVHDPLPDAIAIANVSGIATGAAHACAVGRGRVHCWGQNDDGQLGTGRRADEPLPARVVLPPGVHAVSVAAGGNNSCVVAVGGGVYCWGANGSRQLAMPSGPGQPLPVRIAGLAQEAVTVAIMDESICALLRDGSVACWGDNLLGQLGRGSRDLEIHSEPAPVVFE